MKISIILVIIFIAIPFYSQTKKPTKQIASPSPSSPVGKQESSQNNSTQSQDPIIKRNMINDIVFSKDLSKIDIVVSAINDENKIVRMAAIEGLGILGSSQHEDLILNILLEETDKEIKNSCMVALSYIYPLKNYNKLIQYYRNETDDILKGQAIRLLASKNVKDVENEMITVLNSKKFSLELKVNAIYYLGVIKSTQAVNLLLEYLNDSNKLIRLESIKALGEISDRKTVDFIRARMGENDDDIKIETSLALSKMGDNFGLSEMYKYIDSPNLSYRDKALTVIGAVGDLTSIKILEEKLRKTQDQNLKSFIGFTIEKIKARLKFQQTKK
ncbi:MAG: HEAT repeat domain-containing protein [Elusimicrobiales bacterium]|nr:HEAT repeat domain-containing protein [Elusimicrobiales bacterium]